MSKKKLTRRIILSLSLGMFSLTPLASALPSQGAYDNSAAATIATAGNTMNITGKNANNILNWLTFSVAKGETVKFTDKNNYLNLVNGVDISRIYGTISGGNNVYLVNPYGILFGQGATLDNVGSFIASTRDISDINQQAFLNDPTNVEAVLYTDNNASRNKDYYPDDSPFVPTISVAEINLTNVPASATKIVLDGPGGVVLKNTDVLDQVSQVSTRINGGEVGIGSSTGNVSLSDAQQQKISLFSGSNRSALSANSSVLKSYKLISNANELQAMSNGNYLLANNIDASAISNFRPIEYSGVFDGLGYDISNLKVNRAYASDGSAGLFSTAYGTVRNLNLKEVNISSGLQSSYRPPSYSSDAVGALAAKFTGSISNVNVTSSVDVNDGGLTRYGAVRGYDRVGGLVGYLGYEDSNSGTKSEIRNSSNGATVVLNGVNNAGGIVGTGQGYLFHVYNTGNINIGSTYVDMYKTYYPEGIGGIAGSFGNNNGDRILSAYNTGRVFGGRFAAGIVGLPFAKVGDAYNLGEIVVNDYAYNAVGDIVGAVGTVQGNDWSYPIPTDLAYTSQQTGNKVDSYYVSGKLQTYGGDALQGTNFGTGASEVVVTDLLNKNWHGIGYENNGGDTGGNSGGNTGGDTPGTSPGGSAGGNMGGSTPGTNPGGSTGGNMGGSTPGTNTGGSTGGNTGGNTPGTNTGGSTGGNTGGNGDSTSGGTGGSTPSGSGTAGGTSSSGISTPTDVITPEDALRKYNGIITSIQQEKKTNIDAYEQVFKPVAKVTEKISFPGLSVIVDAKDFVESQKAVADHERTDSAWAQDLLQYTGDTFEFLDSIMDLVGWYISDQSKATDKIVPGLGFAAAVSETGKAIIGLTDGEANSHDWQLLGDSIKRLGVEADKVVDPIKIGVWSPGEIASAYLTANAELVKYKNKKNQSEGKSWIAKQFDLDNLDKISIGGVAPYGLVNYKEHPDEKIVFDAVFLNELLWGTLKQGLGDDYVNVLLTHHQKNTSKLNGNFGVGGGNGAGGGGIGSR